MRVLSSCNGRIRREQCLVSLVIMTLSSLPEYLSCQWHHRLSRRHLHMPHAIVSSPQANPKATSFVLLCHALVVTLKPPNPKPNSAPRRNCFRGTETVVPQLQDLLRVMGQGSSRSPCQNYIPKTPLRNDCSHRCEFPEGSSLVPEALVSQGKRCKPGRLASSLRSTCPSPNSCEVGGGGGSGSSSWSRRRSRSRSRTRRRQYA